jgi:hypothetical protein
MAIALTLIVGNQSKSHEDSEKGFWLHTLFTLSLGNISHNSLLLNLNNSSEYTSAYFSAVGEGNVDVVCDPYGTKLSMIPAERFTTWLEAEINRMEPHATELSFNTHQMAYKFLELAKKSNPGLFVILYFT